MTSMQTNIFDEMKRLVSAANERALLLRALGGLAVRAHLTSGRPVFVREYGDLDFAIGAEQRRDLEEFMPSMGYSAYKQFNLLNGATRQIYGHDQMEVKVDIFVGAFEMCHKIPLEGRLHLHPVTIPLAELLLTKAQIAELNRKDALDIASLLLCVETGLDDHEKINILRIAQLCGQDWGLYKTTSINLKRVAEVAREESLPLTEAERSLVQKRIAEIQRVFETMPKSVQWKLRDKVGTRVRWYAEVEEVAR